MAFPLWANDDFLRNESGSSGFELRTWHDELVFGKRPVNILICDFKAFAMWEGANEAVEVFRLGARDPKRHLILLNSPLRSWFCWCVSLKFNKSIAGTRAPFSSTICGWELKQMERLIGIVICSLFGHEARGMSGGRTDKRRRGRVPDMLGLFDFVGFSPKSPSMIISGCKRKISSCTCSFWNWVIKISLRSFTLMCGIMETCDDDVDDERFSSIRSNLAISASSVAISLR